MFVLQKKKDDDEEDEAKQQVPRMYLTFKGRSSRVNLEYLTPPPSIRISSHSKCG